MGFWFGSDSLSLILSEEAVDIFADRDLVVNK